jgi:wyosine [tRNA(Phe)-imidazoG37] synthetase (radical SAM superfamily)
MIRRTKRLSRIAVAVLTNASMLWQKKVREDLLAADLVVPSLDAVSEEVFQKVNRPVEGLDAKKVLQGIEDFCGEFAGNIYLEIMLLKGINDSEEEIEKIDRFVGRLRLDKIQLNTVIRPAASPEARPVYPQKLLKISALFDPSLPVEIAADFDRMTSKAYHKDLEQAILNLLRRRPTRRDEMATALGIHPDEIAKYLQVLEKLKRVRRLKTENPSDAYYGIS